MPETMLDYLRKWEREALRKLYRVAWAEYESEAEAQAAFDGANSAHDTLLSICRELEHEATRNQNLYHRRD